MKAGENMIDENWRILENEKLGSGGFGEVFKGEHIETGEQVAIKRMNICLKNKNKVIEEILVMYKCSSQRKHPNLVRIIDHAVIKDQVVYIIMELCKDGSLSDNIRKKIKYNPSLSNICEEEEALRIVFDIAQGLKFMHVDLKIIHGDIKPANILLHEGKYKISDFGQSFQGRE